MSLGEEKLEKIKKFIIDNTKNLKEYEHSEIFNIIKKNNVSYTENKNGIFANLNKFSEKLIIELNDFIIYCNNNNNLFQIEYNKRNKIKNNIKDNYVEEKFHINKINNEPVINVNEGIKYNKNNDIDQNELYYAENFINIP